MKTMMALAAGLMLVAGQSAAATTDVAAATAPGAHARAANYCNVSQAKHGVAGQVRGHATNRCQAEGGVGFLGLSSTMVVISGIGLAGIGLGIYEVAKSKSP